MRPFRTSWSGGFLVLVAATAAAQSSSRAAAPEGSPERTEAARLIDGLGEASFDAREESARRLREIGVPALASLRSAAEHPNLEVRYRAKRLVQEVEQKDHERRVAEFERNPEAADDDLVPGLRRFRENVGTDTTAVRLFAEMQRAEPELFQLFSGDGALFAKRFASRCAELQIEFNLRQQQNKVHERLCALLFLGSDVRHREEAQSANLLYSLVHNNEFTKVLKGSAPESPSTRRLLGMWIARTSGAIPYQRLMLAMNFDFREGLVPASEVLKGPGVGFQTQYALLAVARFGSRDDLGLIEKHLSDKTLLGTTAVNGRTTYTFQVRDVALAVALHLSGQDIEQYGFKNLQKHKQFLFAPNTLGFRNNEDRAAAHRKWETWRASQPGNGAEPAKAETPDS